MAAYAAAAAALITHRQDYSITFHERTWILGCYPTTLFLYGVTIQ
jgi:hypothetical protein